MATNKLILKLILVILIGMLLCVGVCMCHGYYFKGIIIRLYDVKICIQ